MVATLGYAGLLDLGLGFSISRFIAKYRAEDNRDALLQVFNTVMAFLSSIGLVLALTADLGYSAVGPAGPGSRKRGRPARLLGVPRHHGAAGVYFIPRGGRGRVPGWLSEVLRQKLPDFH